VDRFVTGGIVKNLLRITVLALVGVVSAVVGVATSSPANAADVIAIANFKSEKCAEPVNGANGALVVQRTCNGGLAQAWARIGVGDRYYYLINQAYPNMCLDVRNGSDRLLVPIQIWSCTNTNGMKWRFERVELPYDRIKSKVADNRYLDVAGGRTDEGAWLQTMGFYSDRSSEIWEIR
jgi:hypothetical protein